MRCHVFQFTSVASLAHHVPDHVLANAGTPYRSGPDNRSEYSAAGDPGRGDPEVDCVFDPLRHWHRADVATFTEQIDDGPVPLACLNVPDVERGEFGAAQPAADQYSDYGAISLGSQIVACDAIQHCSALFEGQPVSRSMTELLGTFVTTDSSSEFRAEQPTIGGFISQPANRRKPLIDAGRGQTTCLQAHPKPRHHDATEGEAGLGTVPGNELVDGELVGAA